MADYELVRALIGDRRKTVTRETVMEKADGVQAVFQLDMYPLTSGFTASLALWVSGVTAATTTYVISGNIGRVSFTPTAVGPLITAGASIYADYSYYALSSGDVSEILSGYTGSPYLAAANAALIIAADASRLFMYMMGDKTVDKRRVASNLLELSKQLENRHYKMRDDGAINARIFTMEDASDTVYYGYDSAVAYLTGTS